MHGFKQQLGVPLQAAGRTCPNVRHDGPCQILLDAIGTHHGQCCLQQMMHRHHGCTTGFWTMVAQRACKRTWSPEYQASRWHLASPGPAADGPFRTTLGEEVWQQTWGLPVAPHNADVKKHLEHHEKLKAAEHGQALHRRACKPYILLSRQWWSRGEACWQCSQRFLSHGCGVPRRSLFAVRHALRAEAVPSAKHELCTALATWLLKRDDSMWQSSHGGHAVLQHSPQLIFLWAPGETLCVSWLGKKKRGNRANEG